MLRRLKSPSNLVNQLNVPDSQLRIVRPSKPTEPQIKSESLKTLAGVLTKIDGADAAASALGITPEQARNAAASRNKTVQTNIKATTNRIVELALTRTMESLGLLDIDRISGESAKNISVIAANMSKIVGNLSMKEQGSQQRTLVIYAPNQKNEKDFSVIDI